MLKVTKIVAMDQYDFYDSWNDRRESDWSEVPINGVSELSENNTLSSSAPLLWRGIDLSQGHYHYHSEEPLILTNGGIFLAINVDGP